MSEPRPIQYPKSFGEMCIGIAQGKVADYWFLWNDPPGTYGAEFHKFRGKNCRESYTDAKGKVHRFSCIWRIRPRVIQRELFALRRAMWHRVTP